MQLSSDIHGPSQIWSMGWAIKQQQKWMNYRHIDDTDEFHKHDVGQNKKEIQIHEYNSI